MAMQTGKQFLLLLALKRRKARVQLRKIARFEKIRKKADCRRGGIGFVNRRGGYDRWRHSHRLSAEVA